MYKKDVISFFGQQVKVAEYLGIYKAAVSAWPEVIPEKNALKLEKLTNGHLKYDPKFYEKAA
jgi:hypothetical protein